MVKVFSVILLVLQNIINLRLIKIMLLVKPIMALVS
jgi:hypothetical protein